MHITASSYLLRIEKMLALPVERLVNPTRLSLSPDSSGESSSGESTKESSSNCGCAERQSPLNNNSINVKNRDSPDPKIKEEKPESPGEEQDVEVDVEVDVVSGDEGQGQGSRPKGQEDSSSKSPCLNLSKPNSSSNSPTSATLKFSIEDILRPDFGLSRFQLLAQQAQKRSRPPSQLRSPVPAKRIASGPGSVSSGESHVPPYKPGSVSSAGSICSKGFQYHSEDSNGSCASKGSRRGDEVVDDTKVNPPVPEGPLLWPAWVYCTRYSDRPSSGPRSRRIRKSPREVPEEKRPRTAFTAEQLSKLKQEFDENRYLTEKRRQDLARDLKLHENQIKIWFQNKRAKLKKSNGTKNGLALQLMAQGLYNHSTVPVDEDDELMMEMM